MKPSLLPPSPPNQDSVNLSRLISRLTRILLSPDPPASISLSSAQDIAKISTYLDDARNLLSSVEKSALQEKGGGQTRQLAEADLTEKKEVLERLAARVKVLEMEVAFDAWDVETEEKTAGAENGTGNHAEEQRLLASDSRAETQADISILPPASTPLLRQRLLPPTSTSSTSATTLESQSDTQALLTTSILSLTSSLKASSQSLSANLALDADALAAAANGLDGSGAALADAGKRMGLVRRAAEGRGLFGRALLYAYIAALVVAIILLVGVVPKLRF
ncbi:MAG: hypothetical protein M1829_006215 [Trizodia sp. TS-e1964]|nr:MAG: hypothetical protein M1829_006215 [Trizodia sp. TS-e1964]